MESDCSQFGQFSYTNSFVKTISILVVDDDTTCLSIVAAILRKWKYQVVTVKNPIDALCTLRIRNYSFDLVVSDVHMPDMNGFELQKQIAQEFKLPVVLMSADDNEGVAIKGIESGAAFFMMKPIAPDDVKDLWQYVSASKKKGKGVAPNKKGSKRNSDEKDNCDKSIHNVDNYMPKKNKVFWTKELHHRFLQAISSLGLERAVPKRILEVMNIPGLTRVNVASHLQKYRLFLKRVRDQFECGNIQSPTERSLADRTLLRSSFALSNNNPALILEELQEPIRSTFYRKPLVNSSSNVGSMSFTNHQPPRTNSSFVPQSAYRQSHLLCNQDTSNGANSTTQTTPNTSTLTNIAIPVGFGCVEAPNTFAGTSGLITFTVENDYISPSTGTSSFGSGGAKYNTYASMNIGNSNDNRNTFDTNVFLQQPYEVGDLDSIFLNMVNNESPNRQQIGEEVVDFGSSMSVYNQEENPVTMNKQSNQQQLGGETIVGSNFWSLGSQSGDYFPSFYPNPSQEQIPGGLFGSNVNSNQGNYLTPNERDDEDFLNSIFNDVPYGEDDNLEGKF